MKISTSFKVTCGYVLLVSVLAGMFYYLYRQTQSMARMSEVETQVARHRQATNRLMSWLLEAENRAQAVSMGREEAYRPYAAAIDSVQAAIYSLDTLQTDSIQHARLDTLQALVNEKRESMEVLLAIMNKNHAGRALEQRIADLRSGKDQVTVNNPTVTGKVVNVQRSYEIEKSKKGFFRRLADAFRPSHTDTTRVRQEANVSEGDTLEADVNVSGRVADVLDDIKREAGRQQKAQSNKADAQANRLRLMGQEMTQSISRLLKSIEAEEQRWTQEALARETTIRRHGAWTVGGVAAAASTLALLLLGRVWSDIRRAARYRNQLEQAKQRAEDLLQQREQLMLTITHDIKAPVSTILGYLELAGHPADRRQTEFYMNSMQGAADHLLQLVTSLLDYHRLEAGKMDAQPVSFNPARLVSETADALRPLADKKNLQLTCRIEGPDTNHTYCGDAFRLRQILNNLLTNALKFTEKGGITLSACITPDHWLHCRVSDTGCGMSEEERQHIFEAFTRLKSAQGQDGVGLGLAITQKLIDLLGGRLEVESQKGKGSTFKVSLPLQRTDDAPDAATAPQGGQARFDGWRILLLDDDRLQLQLTSEMLQRLSCRPADIAAFNQPEDAFVRLQAERFDVLLTDIQMPAMGGFDVLRKVRQLPPPNEQIPVVAVTARADMDEATLQQEGFATCLHKPFSLGDLAAVLQKAHPEAMTGKPAILPEPAIAAAPTPEPSATTPPQAAGNPFAPLLSFAEGDTDAEQAILSTFYEETQGHEKAFRQALEQKDIHELGRLGHKLLPTFTLLQSAIADDLKWLEAQRAQTAWTDEAALPAQRVAAELDHTLRALQQQLAAAPTSNTDALE